MTSVAKDYFRNLRVLLAGNSLKVNGGLSGWLSEYEGISIIGDTDDSKTLLTMADALQPDVVVIDLKMEGNKLGNIIKSLSEFSPDSRLIVLAEQVTPVIERVCKKLGAVSVINKTKNINKLVDEIKSIQTERLQKSNHITAENTEKNLSVGINPKHESILIVDDEPHILDALKDSLENEFDVSVACNATSALELLKQKGREISVIISDQRMPEMNGSDFLAMAKEMSDATRLMITGFSDINAVISAVNEGKIFGYVSKPWDPVGLKVIIYKAAEHYHLLKELQERERRLSTIMGNLSGMVYRCRKNGRWTMEFVNTGSTTLTGYTPIQFTSGEITYKKLINPDDLETVEKEIKQAISCQDRYKVEYRIRTAKGEEKWVWEQGCGVFNEDNQLEGIEGFISDITENKRIAEAMRESEWRFRNIAKATSDAVWDWNISSNHLWWGDGLQTLFGYKPDKHIPTFETWADLIHPEDREFIFKSLDEFISGTDENWEGEYRFLRKDGNYAYVLDRGYIVRDDDGKAIRMVGSVTDLTERKQAQDKILRLNRVYKMLSAINSLIVRVHDKQELFEEACRIAVDAGEFKMAWIGMHDPETKYIQILARKGNYKGYIEDDRFSTNEDSPSYCFLSSDTLNSGLPSVSEDTSNDPRIDDWKERVLNHGFRSIAVLPIKLDKKPVGVIALYAGETKFFTSEEMKLLNELAGDISYALQNIAKEEKLQFLASYDTLTGLSNRTMFYEHLNSMLLTRKNDEKNIALLVCDPQQFRHINNTYGKETGDVILIEIASRLRNLTHDTANLARISNDYFTMILPEFRDSAEIAYIFEKTLQPVLCKPFLINGEELQLSFSAGVSVYPSDGKDAETLYRNAETALKKAKQSGEHYLFYQPEMTLRVAEALQIQNKLRIALKENQFVLHYQPKVDSQSRKIIGLEALIRWNDPKTGLIPPGKFIPILEQSDLILDVGIWAVEQAASDFREWKKQISHTPRIAVNVSFVQLRQKNFVEQIEQAISKNGKAIPVDLEITESILMTELEENINKLQIIRKAGLGIAIDDFGTGYSSLSYIAKLPINALKIDRSFITNMTSQPESMTIVSTVITLAHSLNFKVIAEGVETEEQAKFLSLLKCDQMQGFLFSKPLPANEIFTLLKNNAPL